MGFKASKEYHWKTKGPNELWATDCAHLKVVDWGWYYVEDRTVLLSDNGPGYLSRQFSDYLRLVGIRHIIASPYHPQTNGKIERYHRTIKGEINLVPYEMPGKLKKAIKSFIEYYNYRRYHEGLGDVTPWDVYIGKHLEIISRRKEAKSRTLQARRDYNRTAREQGHGL